MRSSLVQETQLVLADLELVAVLELRRLDPLPVQERPVEAALVLDEEIAVLLDDRGVLPRDGDIVQEDVAVRGAPDRRALALREEMLARAAATGAHDERRPLGLEVVERDRSLVGDVLRREAHRRFPAGLALDEQRAALGAVIGGFRVLEAALGTVDMAHSGGAALPARMAASRSMSTCSRTLLPPVSRSRACSSARSRSIFPCRIRRRYETSCSSCVRSSISFLRSSSESEARSGNGSTESLSSREWAALSVCSRGRKGQPQLETLVSLSAPSVSMISSTSPRSSASSSRDASAVLPSA